MSTTETTATPTTESTAPQQAKDPGELSFTDYQTYRRTGEMPKAEAAEAPPPSASAESTPAAQKEASASDTEATEDKGETDESKEQDAEEAEGDEETSAKDDKPKKKGGFQRRIDKLNARMAAREQEIEYWKQQALKGASATKTDTPVAESAKAASAPDGEPDPNKFETHAEYVQALTDWKVDQKLKERDQKAERTRLETEQQKLERTYLEKAQAFAKETKDFQDVLSEVDHIPLSATVRALILKSGPELAYQLAKDPEEYVRINSMSPLDAAEAVGEIKARIASSKASEGKTKETKKLTQAPKPLEPVNGGQAKVAKSLDDPNLSFADYVKLRREQMKRKRA